MLLRTITGLVGLAVLFACLWGGLPWVFLITLLAAILGIHEFYRLHPPESSLPGTKTAVTAPYTLPLIDDTVTDGTMPMKNQLTVSLSNHPRKTCQPPSQDRRTLPATTCRQTKLQHRNQPPPKSRRYPQ